MIRYNNSVNGTVTCFYPTALAPVLVLEASLITGVTMYRLRHFGVFDADVLHFAVYDEGRRLDLTCPDNGATSVSSLGRG